MTRVATRVLAVLVIALVLAGCAADATVSVAMREDGSGVVRVRVVLDADAVSATEAGGGTLEERVRLADLDAAGWDVEPWRRREDGSAVLVLTKPFAQPEQVEGIVAEINGPDGPLRDVRVRRRRSLVRTEYSAHGTIDLAAMTTGISSDPELTAALNNERVDVAALDQSLLAQLRAALSVSLRARIPGSEPVQVQAAPDRPASGRVRLDARGTVTDTARVGLGALALALLLAAVVVVARSRAVARRRRLR